MKYQEVKKKYKYSDLECHYFMDENGNTCGEYRDYHENGQLHWHFFMHSGIDCGELMLFNYNGTLHQHHLRDGKGNVLATVVNQGQPSTHTVEQLIEIAKEHNLPLLSELPKTEDERTHWNLKWPELPYIEAEAMST